MNRQLFFILLIAIATVGNSVTSAFSSRSSRRATKGRRMLETGVTTRRVFAFTLAGGAHKMFSKMRVSDSGKQNQPSSSSAAAATTSTSLNYRTPGDIEDNFLAADALWQTAMYELEPEELDLDLEAKEEQTSSTAQEDSELVEAAKAFIPVAIEISLVAAACSAQRPFIFQ